MPTLAVNIDHIATLRQQRLGIEPEPVTAALLSEQAGAVGIIVHLREDRRHIQDRDVKVLKQCVQTRLNLEMAATEEMQGIALEVLPDSVCLVPEKRQELTTEGGLAVAGREKELKKYLDPLLARGIEASLFVDAVDSQIKAVRETGAQYIEIHTGHYADAKSQAARDSELAKILKGIELARNLGLKVNLGHGLNYVNVMAFKNTPGVNEYSIGHSIVSRALMTGMVEAVSKMVSIVTAFAD